MTTARFPGLDSLRFWAASFVVFGHVMMNQTAVGLPSPHWGAAFYRGSSAVKLFFALSGFLITYLLLEELRKTGTVSVRKFYLRRVCRIWPLYFAVAAFGLFFYNMILPASGLQRATPDSYDWRLAGVLYLFFLPNLMNALYSVGGILNPLWSIGIEEQFYLAWAPAVRRCRRQLPWLFGAVLVASFALFLCQWAGLFGPGFGPKFVDQLEFHFMAAGALLAWAFHRDPERVLAWPVFSSRTVQLAFAALLAEYYLVGRIPWGTIGEEVLQLVLYPWLLLNVAGNPRNLLPIRHRLTEKFGTVSYGIYMLHMPVIYATSFLFLKTSWWRDNPVGYVLGYWGVALLGTLAVALLSYRYFESPFLQIKERRFAAIATSPTPT